MPWKYHSSVKCLRHMCQYDQQTRDISQYTVYIIDIISTEKI